MKKFEFKLPHAEEEEIDLRAFSKEDLEELEGFLGKNPFLLQLYALRELVRIRSRLNQEFPLQWTNRYQYDLTSAKGNHKLDQFPGKPKFLYVKTCSGTVTAKFDSPNEPSFILSAKDQFKMDFEKLYLSWSAQASKKLIFYVSNREIFRSTLS